MLQKHSPMAPLPTTFLISPNFHLFQFKKLHVSFFLDITGLHVGVTFLFLSFFFKSETVIYLVTEPVRPLEVQLNDDENSKSDLAISWGLHQITVCLFSFVHA